MSKQHKIKRYYKKGNQPRRSGSHILSIVLTVLLLGGLGFAGFIMYEPVMDFIKSVSDLPEAAQSELESSLPPSSSTPEPEPEPEPAKPEPVVFNAVYLPHQTASDAALLDAFLQDLAGTPVNAVMVDIKSAQGIVLFTTKNEKAAEWGVIDTKALDLAALKEKLAAKNLHLVVRMQIFRDPAAASRGRLDYAVRYQNSQYLWLDAAEANGGKPWLNPCSGPAKEYLSALALEAVDAGAAMLVLDSVQFPDNSGIYASFGENTANLNRTQVLQDYIAELTAKVEEKDARIAVYLPASSIVAPAVNTLRYGENPLSITGGNLVLGVLPQNLEAFPPTEDKTAFALALQYAADHLGADAQITVLLPGELDAEQTTAQITQAAGKDYILYNPDGVYSIK